MVKSRNELLDKYISVPAHIKGVELDKDKLKKNPALSTIAKSLLNAFMEKISAK